MNISGLPIVSHDAYVQFADLWFGGLPKSDQDMEYYEMAQRMRPRVTEYMGLNFVLFAEGVHTPGTGLALVAKPAFSRDLSSSTTGLLVYKGTDAATPTTSSFTVFEGLSLFKALADVAQECDFTAAYVRALSTQAPGLQTGTCRGSSQNTPFYNGSANTSFAVHDAAMSGAYNKMTDGCTGRRRYDPTDIELNIPSARSTFHATAGSQDTTEWPVALCTGLAATDAVRITCAVFGTLYMKPALSPWPLRWPSLPKQEFDNVLARTNCQVPLGCAGYTFADFTRQMFSKGLQQVKDIARKYIDVAESTQIARRLPFVRQVYDLEGRLGLPPRARYGAFSVAERLPVPARRRPRRRPAPVKQQKSRKLRRYNGGSAR